MLPRCWLPRRSGQLEHNQCHGPFNFPHLFFSDDLPSAVASSIVFQTTAKFYSLTDSGGDWSAIPATGFDPDAWVRVRAPRQEPFRASALDAERLSYR